ncbi:hypothetical protein QBC34DRAFT_413902 [Podospora aff. communis PSN243]|uniref:Uncharacterized protein n=1 Tax=Podospora aff. communis PSN243 TaxID=3040156 RepID=A0AAV9GAV6_9PEZI|nr:hypothetical protein QBC34DRAFT_413902 [Podospora aff. communis PSN243]
MRLQSTKCHPRRGAYSIRASILTAMVLIACLLSGLCFCCKYLHPPARWLTEGVPACSTNCLTRGGDCGYPDPGAASTPGSAGAGAGYGRSSGFEAELVGKRLVAVPSSPADPFDSLPIKMPLRSLELFHHYTHYRIFCRTAVPKNPDSECVAIALSNPGTFRACLLMTALNYSWLAGPGSLQTTDMEETYLYHKLEAMRLVNEQITDPVQSTSDGCLSLIAALALVESGMGDHVAAEAHLNGLFTLLDMRRPDAWQHRFYGLLQRIILAIGSYIAATKSLDGRSVDEYGTPEPDLGLHDELPHYTKPPSSLFSTAPMIATKLSPFYFGASPFVEACKADVEGLVLINALRRLCSIPVVDQPLTAASSRSSSSEPDDTQAQLPSPPSIADEPGNQNLPPKITAALLADTDSYISSLLFKPHPIYRDIRSGSTNQSRPSPTILASRSASPVSSTIPRSLPIRQQSTAEDRHTGLILPGAIDRRKDVYADLPAESFPSSSRAWATAAYLFLHVLLIPGLRIYPTDTPSRKRKREEVTLDPHLLRLLIDTLRADIQHTEEAMRVGAYSSELWLWKVIIGVYTVEVAGIGAPGGRFARPRQNTREKSKEKGACASGKPNVYGWVIEGGRSPRRMRSASVEMHSGGESTPGGDEDADDEPQEAASLQEQDFEEECTVAAMGAWFDERLRSWSCAARVRDWAGAREALARIVWPAEGNAVFEGEAVAEGLWRRAVGSLDTWEHLESGNELSLFLAMDPRLMC